MPDAANPDFRALAPDLQRAALTADPSLIWLVSQVGESDGTITLTVEHGPSRASVSGLVVTPDILKSFGLWLSIAESYQPVAVPFYVSITRRSCGYPSLRLPRNLLTPLERMAGTMSCFSSTRWPMAYAGARPRTSSMPRPRGPRNSFAASSTTQRARPPRRPAKLWQRGCGFGLA